VLRLIDAREAVCAPLLTVNVPLLSADIPLT